MRNRCEASGLRVRRNSDGRATCPLCGDDWHCLTAAGKLREHGRLSTRELTADQVAKLLAPHRALIWCRDDHHVWIASSDIRRDICQRCPTWRWKPGVAT